VPRVSPPADNQDYGAHVTPPPQVAGGSGGTIATQDEGISVDAAATTLNFVGAGVTATDAGSGVTTVTVPGGASPLTTKGDLYGYDTADDRIPVGTDGDVLTADSSAALGVSWQTPSGGGSNLSSTFIRQALAIPGSTILSSVGFSFGSPSIGAAPALTSTNILTSTARVQISSNASGSTGSGTANSGLIYWFGNASGLGGFEVEFWHGIEATHTSISFAAGLFNATALAALSGGADPSSKINCILMGADQADTNMQIMHNDGSGTCTKVPLGASFPKTAGVMYYVKFSAASNSSSVDYTVERLDSAASASGTLSSDLPGNTLFLNPQFVVGKGAVVNVVTACAIKCIGVSNY
jgi:hypothetical protein